jgi:hypothetical protein
MRPRQARGGLSQRRLDQFLRQVDHRGNVAEADLLPPGVSGRGSQSGRSTGTGVRRDFAPFLDERVVGISPKVHRWTRL